MALILTSSGPLALLAGSATWNANPASGSWTTATNWTPATVPNGPGDIATFGQSAITDLNVTSPIEVAAMMFAADSSAFSISVSAPRSLLISGSGISEVAAGSATLICRAGVGGGGAGGQINFSGTSTADSAIFTNEGGFNNSLGATISFNDSATAGQATFENVGGSGARPTTGGSLIFNDSATAGTAHITNDAPTSLAGGGATFFNGHASADHARLNNKGGHNSTSVQAGATFFAGDSTAANATIMLSAGLNAEWPGASLVFSENSVAADAVISVDGGSTTTASARATFLDNASGGNASMTVSGLGSVDLSGVTAESFTFGSLLGSGIVRLGSKNLIVGSNNLAGEFDGMLQDGGSSGGAGGRLTKTGTGTFTLGRASLHTGGTTVAEGGLQVINPVGSATGSGPVTVNAGTLSGSGIISGTVTIGTGSGAGASVAPSAGGPTPLTLTILRSVTFQADGTYTCALSTKRAQADQVIAAGITIVGGAQFKLLPLAKRRLMAGETFVVLNNTAATPISGTFANLADGATVKSGNNKFQASYTGGDGNDLALTVVP